MGWNTKHKRRDKMSDTEREQAVLLMLSVREKVNDLSFRLSPTGEDYKALASASKAATAALKEIDPERHQRETGYGPGVYDQLGGGFKG